MLEPVELSLSPSCSNCISWSEDGDIAIAAGELVYILTPRIQAQTRQQQQQQQQEAGTGIGLGLPTGANANAGNSQWNITKIKTNIFTQEEFPSVFPEPGSTFSLGYEQSLSHVVGLSWSPTGLAAYSRCILGVLTSNLTLSFWQTVDGSSKWSRVLVVNHSLRDYFMLNVGVDVEVVVRKHRIRAFSWSHSLDITTDTQNGGESSLQGARDLFAVGNDVGDVVFLKVGSAGGGVLRHDIDGAGGYEYSRVEVLSHHSLDESMIPRCIDPNSLFASSLRDRAVITDISWSRWVRIPSKDDSRHTVQSYQALVAVVKGSELDILRVETAIEMEGEDKEVFKCHGSIIGSQPLKTQLEAFSFKGPLYWIPKYDAESIALVVGILGGCVIFVIRRGILEKQGYDFQESDITIYKETFDSSSASWYPPLGFTSTSDNNSSNTSHLYITTFSSFTKCIKLPISREERFFSMEDITPPHPPWQKQINSFKNRFDLDYDLGGTAMAKTWGMANFLGWTVVCCSFHPTDMVQHVTASKERLTVVFAPPGEEEQDQDHTAVGMPWHIPEMSHEDMQRGRAHILRFTLSQRNSISSHGHDQLSKKLLYAASCCAILDQPSFESDLLDEARQSLLLISDKTDLDLNGEISAIDLVLEQTVEPALEAGTEAEMETETENVDAIPEAENNVDIIPTREPPKPTIPPKSEQELQLPGARGIFEVCDICAAGIEWYSPVESQCKEGHMFVRCGLTFLSIQDPSISKRCSRCDGEFIDETKLIAQYQVTRDTDMDVDMDSTNAEVLSRIAEKFTNCVYCGGKFKV